MLKKSSQPFSDLPTVCSNAISEILNQDSRDDASSNFKKIFDSRQQQAHLDTISQYVNIATRGEVPSMVAISVKDKLLTFDLAHFFLKKQEQPTAQDEEDYKNSEQLGYAKRYMCKALGASDEFIRSFIADKKLNIPEEEFEDYKSYFRESSKQLIGKLSEFALNCDYGKETDFLNYFVEANNLEEKKVQGERLTFVERVQSQSSLQQLYLQQSSVQETSDSDVMMNPKLSGSIVTIIKNNKIDPNFDIKKGVADSANSVVDGIIMEATTLPRTVKKEVSIRAGEGDQQDSVSSEVDKVKQERTVVATGVPKAVPTDLPVVPRIRNLRFNEGDQQDSVSSENLRFNEGEGDQQDSVSSERDSDVDKMRKRISSLVVTAVPITPSHTPSVREVVTVKPMVPRQQDT